MAEKMSKNQIKVISIGIILCLVTGLFIIYGLKSKQEVVASVNGADISKDEFYKALVESNGDQVLDSLISQKIIKLESIKQKIVVSDADVQNEINNYYEYYGGEEAFKQALEMNGYSLDQIKGEIVTNLQVEKLLGPDISITEEEMQAYFEENKATFAHEKQVKASHILVASMETANEIKQKLVKGEDFAQLAKDYSTDTITKDNGGDVGFFGTGEMEAEFEQAAFALKVGEISEPIKTDYGYHIIKLVEIKDAQEANYEQSKATIKDTLLEEKIGEKYSDWMQELYEQYNVHNSLS